MESVIFCKLSFNYLKCSSSLLLGTGGLLGQEDGLDVGQDAALGDGDAGQQLVQLLIIPGTKVQQRPQKGANRLPT